MIPEYKLDGKIALITGAGRGIGKGIAEVLAEAGADIALNALTPQHVVKVAEQLAVRTGRRIIPCVADVTRSEQVEDLFGRVMRDFGRLDILVNNLGDHIHKPLVPIPGQSGEPVTDEEIKKVMDINLTSAILCSRVVGPHFLQRRSGKVITISSFAALRAQPHQTLYAAAKSALWGFTRSLALEWAPYGIQVNAISPGFFPDIVTMGEEGYRNAMERWRGRVPLGREGCLREVGLLALYLASDASNYMTGQMLFLDGGFTV
jgi:NAD(P)-dependent dehydrogenase (short-subunit alcohol dehydrogenase family)